MNDSRVLCITNRELQDSESNIYTAKADELPTSLFDFDVIIVDFQVFKDYEDTSDFFNRKSQIQKLLKSGGLIFVSSFDRQYYTLGNQSVGYKKLSSTMWLPFDIQISDEAGATIENIHKSIKNLIERFGCHWEVFFTKYPENSIVLAENRTGDAISLAIPYESGYVIFLPYTDNDEMLYLIKNYKNIFDNLKENKEMKLHPKWLDNFLTPKEKTLIENANVIEKELTKYGDFKRLIFESGDNLANITKKALEEYGFNVEVPGEGTVPDLEISLSTDLKGIVEIKGVHGIIDLDDMRQLLHYFVDKRDIEKENVKGIFIANYGIDEEPDKRGEAFSKDAIKLANNHNICLLTTLQIYYSLLKIWEGKISKEEVRNKIIETSGLCNLV